MQIFAEIELLPEDIGRLIQELKDIARGLAGISGTIVSDALTLSATEDTASLMQALSGKKCILTMGIEGAWRKQAPSIPGLVQYGGTKAVWTSYIKRSIKLGYL